MQNLLVYKIDKHINWKNHIAQMIPKLSGLYYSVRSMVHIINIKTLKSIYYAYIHSTIKCGIIFGVTLTSVQRFSLCKRKPSELWLVHKPQPHVEVNLNN